MAGMAFNTGARFSRFVSSLRKKRQNTMQNDNQQAVKRRSLTKRCSGEVAECGVMCLVDYRNKPKIDTPLQIVY